MLTLPLPHTGKTMLPEPQGLGWAGVGMGSVPPLQCSHCSAGTPRRPQGGPTGHSGCRGCCCRARIPDTLSLPGGTCTEEQSGVSGHWGCLRGPAREASSGPKMGKLWLPQNDAHLLAVSKNARQHSRARSPVSSSPPSLPSAGRTQTQSLEDRSTNRHTQSLKGAPTLPWVSSPGPSDSPLLLPAWWQHLLSHRVDLQAVAAPVAPAVLLGAAKEQVLGQSLSKAESSLALPRELGLLQCGLDQEVTWAPGIRDVFQLCLQCLEAVLGAWCM